MVVVVVVNKIVYKKVGEGRGGCFGSRGGSGNLC